jgi:DNA-binding transcriptional LysR family regulator
MVDDVDLRKLRYFVAVADELHFGRASEKLHIAQPVLSRQIRSLEDQLGVKLLERSTRGTSLTPVGESVLVDARSLLLAATALAARARRVGTSVRVMTLGVMPGILPTPIIRSLREKFPGLTVESVRTSWDNQTDLVRDGTVGASFVRLPIDARGLNIVPLFDEPRVVALPIGHPLSTESTVSIAELADLDLVQNPDAVPEWRDTSAQVRSNKARGQARSRTVEEKLELVANEQGIVVLPQSTADYYTRPDVVYRLVRDIPPSQVALAYDSRRVTPELLALIGIAVTQEP